MEQAWRGGFGWFPASTQYTGRAAKDPGLQEVHPSSCLGEDPVLKGQILNSSDFSGHTISVAIQHCPCHRKVAVDDIKPMGVVISQ